MKVGIVAGEASGDLLGAALMSSLRQRTDDLEFVGVGGQRMESAGLCALYGLERFSMNGFLQPMLRIPELLALLNDLERKLAGVDVMVGVDFNVFNFMLERRLKTQGVPTVHYVSPSVYAWRRGRIGKIEKCADLLLTLFPFEPGYYKDTSIDARFVGHPQADLIDPDRDLAADRKDARENLEIDPSSTVVALLPGSRGSELRFHLELFLKTAERIVTLLPSDERCVFVVPCASDNAIEHVDKHASRFDHLDLRIDSGGSLQTFAASDVALVKSGTSTLEALLLRVPMVVTYQAGPITYSIVRSVLQTDWVALPNILTQSELVPEFLQQAASTEVLAIAVCEELARSRSSPDYLATFDQLHRSLRKDNAACAAEAVLDLVEGRSS
ncbi:MAG: lipid-A-disaccharide synthase [Gammaproteobacteria bacterium]|nr:lipid-A-disaccharide synthase [Gammaproteobacteria bacterium]